MKNYRTIWKHEVRQADQIVKRLEEDVIQAAISSMRKGTKTDRRRWFEKVKATTKQIRLAEADHIYQSLQ
jgi:hypothetical protein